MKYDLGSSRRTNKSKTIVLRIVLATVVFVLLFSLVYANVIKVDPNSPKVEHGVLDLSSWDLNNEQVLFLGGEWEFYWQQSLEKADFHEEETPIYVAVPHVWEDTPFGSATYRLHISQAPTDQPLAIKLGKTSITYRVFVDDVLILINDPPANTPRTASFKAPASDFDLIMHVYNSAYPIGGVWYSVQMGTEQHVTFMNTIMLQKESILLGILIIMALYYFSFYLVIRKDRLNLLFAIGSALLVLRISLYGERTMYLFFPSLSYDSLLILAHLADVWSPLPFMYLVHYLFPKESWKLPLHVYIIIAGVYSVLLFAVPIDVIVAISIIMYTAAFFSIGSSVITVVRALFRKRSGTFPHVIGFISIAVLGFHDMLYSKSLVPNRFGELASIGVTIFLIAQAFVLAERYFRAFGEIERLSRNLAMLNRQKDEFLTSTSYELKTPLNGIVGITESLKDGAVGDLNYLQKYNLELVIQSGRRLNHLLDDLLVYSRLKYEPIKLHFVHVPLDGILQPIVEFHRWRIRGKSITIRTEVPQATTIFADENRVIQILHNIIEHVLNSMEHGAMMIIVDRLDDEWIEIAIRVSNTATSMEIQPLLFASFDEIDHAITKNGGVGLGLPISKYLIEQHGGIVTVDSDIAGGTTIRFTLPVGNVVPEDALKAMKEIAVYAPEAMLTNDVLYIREGSNDIVLVVDDDLMYVHAIINFLVLDGYSIIAATDSEKAWAIVEEKRNSISLVIADVMMPKLSGYELCRKIRTYWTEIEMPVLLMTAVHKQEGMLAGFEAGANDYVTKPFEPEEFRARVRTLQQMKSTMTKVKEVELAFLQAQIKPHFLYNTLNTIATFCVKNPYQARDLISDLATYLRHSFDFHQIEQLVPIETELELVEAYLNIEQVRFGERLHIHYDIAPDVGHVLIPQLTIQPLAENAVRHGVMKRSEGGTIRIQIAMVGAICQITIKDDGAGITEEQLAMIFTAERHLDKGRVGIGLKNIDARLKKLFGNGLSFHMEEGTEVSFQVPVPITPNARLHGGDR